MGRARHVIDRVRLGTHFRDGALLCVCLCAAAKLKDSGFRAVRVAQKARCGAMFNRVLHDGVRGITAACHGVRTVRGDMLVCCEQSLIEARVIFSLTLSRRGHGVLLEDNTYTCSRN